MPYPWYCDHMHLSSGYGAGSFNLSIIPHVLLLLHAHRPIEVSTSRRQSESTPINRFIGTTYIHMCMYRILITIHIYLNGLLARPLGEGDIRSMINTAACCVAWKFSIWVWYSESATKPQSILNMLMCSICRGHHNMYVLYI